MVGSEVLFLVVLSCIGVFCGLLCDELFCVELTVMWNGIVDIVPFVSLCIGV